jgi:hypothetical protein
MQNVNITKQQDLLRFLLSSSIRVRYTQNAILGTTPVAIDNFTQMVGVTQTNTRVGEPCIYKSKQPLYFNSQFNNDKLVDNISSVGFINDLPDSLEYLKYRVAAITITKKNIKTPTDPPTESKYPVFKDDDVIICLNDINYFPVSRDNVENRNEPPARDPPQDGDIINYKVSRTNKSEWIYFRQGITNFNNMTLQIYILHSNPVTNPATGSTGITHRITFLQQRFFSFNISLEFEAKKAEPLKLEPLIVEEPITMNNLYKMLSSYFKIKPSQLNSKLDGVTKEILEEVKRKEKRKGVFLEEPFTDQQIELFINKIIGSLRNV